MAFTAQGIKMKVLLSVFLTAAVSGIFLLRCPGSSESKKGAYVISLESWHNGQRIFRFPDDSIFVSGGLAVQQVMRLDQFDFNGKVSLMQSVEAYYLIDFKRGLYKDMGKDLEQEIERIPWKDLSEKQYGTNFRGDLHFNENFSIKDTLWESRQVKKISYTAANRERYDIILKQCPPKERRPVFFDVIEQRFKGEVLQMIITYPNGVGTAVYTTKFAPLEEHPVLDALNKLK